VAIFLAVGLSTAVYTTYVMRSLQREAEQNLHERAERLAAVLSQALARPLFDLNSAAISSVVDASGATPEVLVLRVLAPGGNELASYVSPQHAGPIAAINVHRDIVFSDVHRSYPVGSVDLAYSRAQMDSNLQHRILSTVAANLLLALGIVLSIFVVGRRTAERELRALNAELEQRISERTAELSQAAAAARDSEARLQNIVDTALDAVVRMDPQGRIVGWNRQAEIIFGWSRDEALGRDLSHTIIPLRLRHEHKRGVERYMASGRSAVMGSRIEIAALRRNGEEFPIELAITQVRTEGGGHEFCAFIRDISERRAREHKLVNANMRAEAANIAKSEFLANMSHEIRTPMSAVIGMAYLALRTELTPRQHDYISKIHRAALSLLGIINDILDFSKIEAGRLEMESIPFDLRDVLDHVGSVTAQRAADKQLRYQVELAPDVPRYLVGDPLRLGQVLINLVNNAVKFTLDGELELRCTVAEATRADTVLRFAVRDTGIGMTPAQKARLFRAFSQANGSTTRQFGGTGLGLSISQQLVRLMGGDIEVESEVDRGSEFRFALRFPLADAAALAAQNVARHTPFDALAMETATQRPARVLLAEDSGDNQDVTRELLAVQGLDVEVVSNGREAVDRLAQAEPGAYDLVLMDLNMPVMDGHEATRLLRADRRHSGLPIVAVTANALAGMRQRCLDEGMQDYITKPIDPQRLYRVLSRWLGRAMPVVPPWPPLAQERVAAGDPREAALALGALLAEFSGDSVEYYEHARASLSALLVPEALARMDHHIRQYEFEAAGRLLAAAIAREMK